MPKRRKKAPIDDEHEAARTVHEEEHVPMEQDEQHAQHLPKHAHTIIEPPDGAAAIGDNAPCEQEQSAETPDASIDKDNYIIFMENE